MSGSSISNTLPPRGEHDRHTAESRAVFQTKRGTLGAAGTTEEAPAPVSALPNDDVIDPGTIIPLTNRKNRYDDGLDWLRGPSNDLPAGAISISSEVSLLTPDGTRNVLDTYSTEQWHRKNKMDRRYDGRYEGRSTGYPDDPDNYSTSGLRCGLQKVI